MSTILIKFGTKEYEQARIDLAKKLNIDVQNIDRAHSIMAPRLAKLAKLIDEGTMTVEQAKKLSKPQYFLLKADNSKHIKLENKLDILLKRKKNFLDEKDFTSANKAQEGIEDITKQMEELGVESELFDPIKKLIKVFGRRPDPVELYKKAKKTGIKKKDGGVVSIEEMIRPIKAQR
jgi:polyhydroxyalkanoate synthesis regulator phasin